MFTLLVYNMQVRNIGGTKCISLAYQSIGRAIAVVAHYVSMPLLKKDITKQEAKLSLG